jgi:hypothetical protein
VWSVDTQGNVVPGPVTYSIDGVQNIAVISSACTGRGDPLLPHRARERAQAQPAADARAAWPWRPASGGWPAARCRCSACAGRAPVGAIGERAITPELRAGARGEGSRERAASLYSAMSALADCDSSTNWVLLAGWRQSPPVRRRPGAFAEVPPPTGRTRPLSRRCCIPDSRHSE